MLHGVRILVENTEVGAALGLSELGQTGDGQSRRSGSQSSVLC